MAPVSLPRDGSHTPSIHSSSTGVRQPEHQRARSPRKGGPEQKSREKSHRRKKKKVFSKSRNVSSRHSKRERERGKIIIIKLSFTFNFFARSQAFSVRILFCFFHNRCELYISVVIFVTLWEVQLNLEV